MGQLHLTRADGLPQGILDKAQLWDFRRDPILARIETRHALTCARVFDIALAIPDEAADVEFIVD